MISAAIWAQFWLKFTKYFKEMAFVVGHQQAIHRDWVPYHILRHLLKDHLKLLKAYGRHLATMLFGKILFELHCSYICSDMLIRHQLWSRSDLPCKAKSGLDLWNIEQLYWWWCSSLNRPVLDLTKLKIM